MSPLPKTYQVGLMYLIKQAEILTSPEHVFLQLGPVLRSIIDQAEAQATEEAQPKLYGAPEEPLA